MNTSRFGTIPALRRTVFAPRLARATRPIRISSSAAKSRKRSPTSRVKYGIQWTLKDLQSYNIHLHEQDALTFFGVQHLPSPFISPSSEPLTDELNKLLRPVFEHYGTRVWWFVRELFQLIEYDTEDRISLPRFLPLRICGKYEYVLTEACLVAFDKRLNDQDIRLVVQEDKRIGDRDAQARLVAGAVGAFAKNNRYRVDVGLEPLVETIIPGIVMAGTSPTFFKIPVSKTLSTHIRGGTYPPDATTVTFCEVPVPQPVSKREAMLPLDNRRQILSCYEAFRTSVMGL